MVTERPFAVRDLGEVAIRCLDLDAMFAFYRDVIGLAPLRAPADGMAFLRVAPGHAGHTRVLALFLAEAPPAGASRSLHHFALNVDFDAQEAAAAWLGSRGLDVRMQDFPWIGWRGVFLRDPEGNTVELVAFSPDLREQP